MRIIENADKGIIPDETYEDIELDGNYVYPAVFTIENGRYFAEFPDFDNVWASGNSEQEAAFEAAKVLASTIEGYFRLYHHLPMPSDVDSLKTEDCESVSLISANMESCRER